MNVNLLFFIESRKFNLYNLYAAIYIISSYNICFPGITNMINSAESNKNTDLCDVRDFSHLKPFKIDIYITSKFYSAMILI